MHFMHAHHTNCHAERKTFAKNFSRHIQARSFWSRSVSTSLSAHIHTPASGTCNADVRARMAGMCTTVCRQSVHATQYNATHATQHTHHMRTYLHRYKNKHCQVELALLKKLKANYGVDTC